MSELVDPFDTAGSPASSTSSGSLETPSGQPAETGQALSDVRGWLSRFVLTMTEADLDVLTLWAAHTHLVEQTYTTPRLVLDSPVPGSGKTTVLEHLDKLCVHPVQMASLSSPALLVRILSTGMRTLLIDEADRALNPDKDGVGELFAVLNSGYKRGATRPVLVPSKEDGWVSREMPTFAPVVMAGNNPNLPEDTRSRTIRVLLLPDLEGRVEESDWELIEPDARALGARLSRWADLVRDQVREHRPPLPEGIVGRARERWSPLKRVATAAGDPWPDVVDALALADLARMEQDKEDGMVLERPAVVLLRDLHEIWPDEDAFASTEYLRTELIAHRAEMWSGSSAYGRELTAQRLGRMLVQSYNVHSTRQSDGDRARGYVRAALTPAWRRMGVQTLPREPDEPAEPVEPDPAPALHPVRSTTCQACNLPMKFDDGTGTHPGCGGDQ